MQACARGIPIQSNYVPTMAQKMWMVAVRVVPARERGAQTSVPRFGSQASGECVHNSKGRTMACRTRITAHLLTRSLIWNSARVDIRVEFADRHRRGCGALAGWLRERSLVAEIPLTLRKNTIFAKISIAATIYAVGYIMRNAAIPAHHRGGNGNVSDTWREIDLSRMDRRRVEAFNMII